MKNLIKNSRLILPSHQNLQYSGRIDDSDPTKPLFIYPASLVRMKCSGSSIHALIRNCNKNCDNYIGAIIDGKQTKHKLSSDRNLEIHILAENLEDTVHDVVLFKRMDGCHYFEFHGFVIDVKAHIQQVEKEYVRRIEVYGDSVSAGEVAEVEGYEGKGDPVHQGEYSNAWYSYAWFAARNLNAQLHDIAQGGIALLDNTGYFLGSNKIGMLSVFDKLCYNPELGEVTYWNFEKYRPHVVVVAIGQNDSFPQDIMKEEFYGVAAVQWRNQYKSFVQNLRKIYPQALIILATTIMEHDAGWDESIDMVCREIVDKKTVHFLYQNNGSGTKGHVRISEAQKKGKELADYIESFGEDIWRD